MRGNNKCRPSLARLGTWVAGALVATATLIGCSGSNDDDDSGGSDDGPGAASASSGCTPGNCFVNKGVIPCSGFCAGSLGQKGTHSCNLGTGTPIVYGATTYTCTCASNVFGTAGTCE